MITKSIAPDCRDEALRQLYESAFPANERIPWPDLLRLVGEMPLDFTAYYQADGLVGFTIVYPRPSFNWFWYFAVRPELRSRGLGQQILTQLIDKYRHSTNILDMESPEQPCDNLAQRQRRRAFYRRNGFRDTGVVKSFDDVDMTIMIMGPGTFTMHDYDDLLAELHRHWQWEE